MELRRDLTGDDATVRPTVLFFCLFVWLLVCLVLLSNWNHWDNNQVMDFNSWMAHLHSVAKKKKKTKSDYVRASFQTRWGNTFCNHLSHPKCYFPVLCTLWGVATASKWLLRVGAWDRVPSRAKWADGAWFPFQRAHGWYNWSRQSEDEMILYLQSPTHPHGDILILLSLLLPSPTCQAIELYSSESTNGTPSWLETSSRCSELFSFQRALPQIIQRLALVFTGPKQGPLCHT